MDISSLPVASSRESPLARPDLYRRLMNGCPDSPETALTFAGKLARENRWTVERADRMITEYRRFLSLAVVAGHPVCPSDPIDQAWHQHLLDTREYWEEFCPRVLGNPLHHSPSKGRPGEEGIPREWYVRTLASYQATFGESPPTDLWPPTERRFGGEERRRGVDEARFRFVARPQRRGATPPWLRPRTLRQPLAAAGPLALGGHGPGASLRPPPDAGERGGGTVGGAGPDPPDAGR